MKGSILARVGLGIAGALLSASAFAQGPGSVGGPGPGMGEHRPPFERAFGGHGNEGRWWNNPRIIERLKLTDDQRKAFDQILLEHRETLIDLRANVEKAELKMEPLVRDDQPNESAILAQIDKVAQARAELEKANARYLLALRSKLTPDQWKQVQALRENHGRENWGSRDRRPGGQGPGDRGPRNGNGPNNPPPAPGPQGAADGDAPPSPADLGSPGAGIN
jgi:Spy/CpxP family protein refolding chaperone